MDEPDQDNINYNIDGIITCLIKAYELLGQNLQKETPTFFFLDNLADRERDPDREDTSPD